MANGESRRSLGSAFWFSLCFSAAAFRIVASSPLGVRSKTANFFSVLSSSFLTSNWMPTLTPMRSGIRTRLTMNDLVRTAARYSRTAMTMTLRMGDLLGVGAGDADEDIVQRRTGQLEMAHPAATHEPGQNLLRVSPPVQPQLLPATEIRHLGNAGQFGQRVTALDANPQGVVAVIVLNRFERPVQDLLASEDHENEITHLFRHRHVVRGEDEGGSLAPQF